MDADIFSKGMIPKNFSRVDSLLKLVSGDDSDFSVLNGGVISTAGNIHAKMVENGIGDQLNRDFVDVIKHLPPDEMVWWKRTN